jgi:hypothetical protein
MPATQGIFRLWRGNPYEQGEFIGTGFAPAETFGITARHVACQATTERPLFILAPWLGVFLIKILPDNLIYPENQPTVDICAFRFPTHSGPSPSHTLQSFWPDTTANPPKDIFVYGFADKHTPIEQRPFTHFGIDGTCGALIYSGSPARGMSGGPALTPMGAFVGVTWARNQDQDRTYITPLANVKSFLDQAGLEFRNLTQATEMRMPDHPTTLSELDINKFCNKLSIILTEIAPNATETRDLLVKSNELMSIKYPNIQKEMLFVPTDAFFPEDQNISRWTRILGRRPLTRAAVIAICRSAQHFTAKQKLNSQLWEIYLAITNL